MPAPSTAKPTHRQADLENPSLKERDGASLSSRSSSRRAKTAANGRNYVREHELRSVIARLDIAADALADASWRGSVALLGERPYDDVRTAIAKAADYLVTLSREVVS